MPPPPFLTEPPKLPVTRKVAWGYLTINLALPGVGSLMAGRKVGYFQISVAALGIVATTVFGIKFILWALLNWTRLHQPDLDPVAPLLEMWFQVRWALLGMASFLMALIWALGTSMSIWRNAIPDPAKQSTGVK